MQKFMFDELLHHIIHGDPISLFKPKLEKALLEGFNIDYQDDYGRTLLHHAVQHGTLDIIKALIKEDASVNMRDNYGQTPLIYVMKKPETVALRLEMLRTLLDGGADIEAKSGLGETVLNIVCTKYISGGAEGWLDIVKELLDRGAEITPATERTESAPPPLWAARTSSSLLVPLGEAEWRDESILKGKARERCSKLKKYIDTYRQLKIQRKTESESDLDAFMR